MDSDNLRALVEDFKEKGNSDESIVKLLTAAGYSEEKVREYLGQNNGQPSAADPGKGDLDLTASLPRSPKGLSLMAGFTSLFNNAVEMFKERIWVLVGIYLIPVLVSALVVSPLISYFGKNPSAVPGIAMGAALLVFVLLSALAVLGILYSLKDGLNVVQSYAKAWKGVLGYYWIVLLGFLIGCGGLALGVIPAFIFGVWFIFGIYVYVFQKQKGLNALLRSKEYITNYWWGFDLRSRRSKLCLLF